MQVTKTSKKFAIDLKDLAKGFLTAAIAAVIATCGQIIEIWLTSPSFSMDKMSIALILKTALGGGIAYLVKQFLTPAKTILPSDAQLPTKEIDPSNN